MSLAVDAVTKSFGSVRALDGVSFSVEPGRIFGLLGANGAGKTTLMRIVLDILRADSGSVTWEGRANTDLPRRLSAGASRICQPATSDLMKARPSWLAMSSGAAW